MDKLEKCSYADRYQATFKPVCGCKTCEQKWDDKYFGRRRITMKLPIPEFAR